MATEVFKTEPITLLDGTEIVLRPLPIKHKRVFLRLMQEWREYSQEMAQKKDDDNVDWIEAEEKNYDLLTNMAVLCLKSTNAPDNLKVKDDDGKYSDLENVLDDDSLYKILEVCGGVNLKLDPEMLMELMKQQEKETDGTS